MDLNITKLAKMEEKRAQEFLDRIESKLIMDVNKNSIVENSAWMDMLEFSIPHVEKALIKQIKQIVTEEEIIKIELIKKVTVESVKHLSKNVNFVDHIEPQSGDVIPKKILNAYKEETFLTYENKFLYSLVKLIEDFMYLRKKDQQSEYKGKNQQKAVYEARVKLKKEKIIANFDYTTEMSENASKTDETQERIKAINQSIKTLKSTELYQILDSKRFPLIKGTLKMTNVLLKNVHFQYAVKLWNYLNEQIEIRNKSIKLNKEYEEKGPVKSLVDENIFLLHLIFENVKDEQKRKGKRKQAIEDKEIRKGLSEALMERLIDLNPDLTEIELKQMIADKFVEMKTKKIVSLKPVEDKFKEKIEKYMEHAREVRLK